MTKKSKKEPQKTFKLIITLIGSFFLALFLSGLLFVIMIPFLIDATNLPDAQQAAIGEQNMWRIVAFYGIATLIITGITFYKRKFIFIGIAFITYWILGTGLVIFINSQESFNSPNEIVDWNSCREQDVLQQAKACTFSVNTDSSTGTGFAYRDNYIITNFHVIEGGNKAWTYTSDSGNREVPIKLWGYSRESDIAVMKIDTPLQSCTLISSSNLPLAETLYAVGWPNGLEGESSITKGTFSRKVSFENKELIQTDAPINPGNSGGPLVSRCGIVGINQSIIRWSDSETPAEGLGFAISSSHALPIIDGLIKSGSEQGIPSIQESNFYYQDYDSGNSSDYDASGYDVNGWVNARDETRALVSYWNNVNTGGYDQAKVAQIRDLLARMSSVVENITPKLQAGQSLSSEENRLLGEWNGMYSQVETLSFQLRYSR